MPPTAAHPDMQYRTLGRTGERVSAIGLGGWHIGLKHVDEQLNLRIVRTAVDRGITFLDNCWDYNDGASEVRMGKALRDGYRDKVFLMTKIDGRSKKEAARQLDESLRRLQVETIDLVQHHEILRYEDPHRVFDPDGANAALVEARAAGKLRYIGFTGHKDPHVHLQMLEVTAGHGFTFDTVQMPLNVMDAHYRSFAKLVLPELVKQNIGVLGMKPLANGILLRSKTVTPIECLHYALNLPTSVVITGIDSNGGSRPGAGGGAHVPAAERFTGAVAVGEDGGRRGARRIRAVQDHVGLRRHGAAPGMARGGAAARPGVDAQLVRCQVTIVGYSRLSLMRALSVVKRQSIRACAWSRWHSHAATARINSSSVPMRRFRHCPVSTLNSISAMFSHEPCLGV
jgi:diketogulonate reductase-like aldo/keto reductase